MKTTATTQSGVTLINARQSFTFVGMAKWAKRTILSSAPLVSTARLFSTVIEQEVAPLDVLHILNLFLALCLAVFPVEMPLLLRIAAICWLAKAVSAVRHLDLFKDEN